MDSLHVQHCILIEKEREIPFTIVFCTMCNVLLQCSMYVLLNCLLHNVQQTTAILPHSSCVCQAASWHYHQSKAFLDLVGGAAGSYCTRPIFCPKKMWVKMAKLGANLDCSVCTNLTKIQSISPSQYLIELSATAHKRAIII